MTQEIFLPPRNFAGLSKEYTDPSTSRIIILPVPYDSTSEWRSGSRDGPQAIIDASQYLELYDPELDYEPYRSGIHTLPLVAPVMSGPEQMIQQIYNIALQLIRKPRVLAMFGGEHSVTLGMVKAFVEHTLGLSVLQLDAHADLRNEYQGTRYSHACVMRRVVELCPIVQVGIRSFSLEEQRFLEANGMQPFSNIPQPFDLSNIERIVAALSDEVYVTIDLDVFDPSVMPSVGTPEPGGMNWFEVVRILSEVARQRKIIGFDIVELCPSAGTNSCSYLAAKLAYKIISYVNAPMSV